jgi:hypothetical protein
MTPDPRARARHPRLVADFLTQDGGYPDEWAIACPTCASDYSHIREAGTLLGGDEGHVYPGTAVLGVTPDRRSALTIVFDGECGHAWELRIQQHKGVNLVTVQPVAAMGTLDEERAR